MSKNPSKLVLPAPVLSLKDVADNDIKPNFRSFFLAAEMVDVIIDKGANRLYQKYLRSKLAQHNSTFFVTAYSDLSFQEIMPYDPGENIDNLVSNWKEDEEPDNSELDTWCAFAAKVKSSKNQIGGSMHNDSFISLADSIGSKGRSSFNRIRSAYSKMSFTRLGSKKTTELDQISEQQKLMTQEYDVKITRLEGVKVEEEEEPGVDIIRQEIALKRKIHQQKIEDQLEEQRKKEELQEKVKAFDKQAKNNAYTFDFDGKVLFTKPQPINPKKSATKYNLNRPLLTIQQLPDDPPVRTDEKEDKRPSLSLASHVTPKPVEEVFPMSKTFQFREAFNVRPGVALKMTNAEKVGPEFKSPYKMRKDDFNKILEERKRDNGRPQKELKKIEETESEEHRKQQEAESALANQLKELEEMYKLAGIEVHDQDLLVQMILYNQNNDLKKIRELGKGKEQVDQEAKEEERKPSVLEDRVVPYNQTGFSELKNKEAKPKLQVKIAPSKVQEAMDHYNRKLLKNDAWAYGSPRTSAANTNAKATPKISPEKKLNLKAAIFESHTPKEPRERTTVGQKRVLMAQTARASVESELVSPNLDNILSARAADSQSKKFIIRSSGVKEKPNPPAAEVKPKHESKPSKGKEDLNPLKVRQSGSVSSAKSKNSGPRASGV